MTLDRSEGRRRRRGTFRFRDRLPRVAGRRGTTSLVLGILGLVGVLSFGCCTGIALPVFAFLSALAWSLGQSDLRMYRALGAVGTNEGSAKAGYVMGIIGVILAGLMMVGSALYMALIIFLMGFQQKASGITLMTEY